MLTGPVVLAVAPIAVVFVGLQLWMLKLPRADHFRDDAGHVRAMEVTLDQG